MPATYLRQRQKSYKKHFLAIVVAVIIVIAFLVLISLGEAKITVHPKYETAGADFTAEIVPAGQESDNKISGRILSTVTRGTEKITEVDRRETEKQATGQVVIHNELDHDQPLVATTRLLSRDGVLFRIKDRVNAPAHGTVTAEVYADEPGPKGEIGPTRFTVPGLWEQWQNQLYAESTESMTGGFGEADYISQETIDRGIQTVVDKITEEGKQKLNSQTTPGEKVLDDAINVEVLSSSASVKPDTLDSEFTTSAEVRLTAVVFAEDSLYKMAEARLRSDISDGVDIKELSRDTFSYTLELYDLQKKTATLSAHLEAKTASQVSSDLFDKEKLIGRNRDEVIDYLNREQDVGEVEVEFSPTWIKSVPAKPDQIEIIVTD